MANKVQSTKRYTEVTCVLREMLAARLARSVLTPFQHWPVGSLTRVGGMVALPLAIQLANVFLARQRPPLFYRSQSGVRRPAFLTATFSLCEPIPACRKSPCLRKICGSPRYVGY